MKNSGPAAVSIVIPAWNAARFLADAIDSLLGQDPRPAEILVIDDGSTDDTDAVMTRYAGDPVRCFRQDNRGPAAARNRGVKLARHAIVGFLDADDLWTPGSLREQLAVLCENPAVTAVKGMTQVLELVQTASGETGWVEAGSPFLFANFGGTLYRREVFERVGPIDEALKFSEDIDWLLRARELGVSIRVLQVVTQYHRRHGANMTADRSPQEMNMLKVMKMAIDRKRKAGESHAG